MGLLVVLVHFLGGQLVAPLEVSVLVVCHLQALGVAIGDDGRGIPFVVALEHGLIRQMPKRFTPGQPLSSAMGTCTYHDGQSVAGCLRNSRLARRP